ncbi:MAG: lipoyl synthase [Anaerosomatales bacterium]|nr:lipoyl synthase [Anaerosomatales bacterium]MDT8434624.1 lipoyl synthase [Anaerosomatales bacterium]
MTYAHGTKQERLPEWLRRPIATPGRATAVEGLLGELRLNTVCQSAKCPNRGECYASGTATFLIMGDACTRGCRFCAVETRVPAPLDAGEPARVAEAARRMGLAHVVVTTVTRDDLPDGGAAHFVAVIEALREAVPDATVEVLTSDFAGNTSSIDAVTDARPDVFNHNLETVPRLYPEVRPGAEYRRSLGVLARVKERCAEADAPPLPTKSGLMLGLGETPEEVVAVMRDLREAGCDLLTLGQYLRPSPAHLPVAEFVEPAVFEELAREGRALGFSAVESAPFVRSSYHAKELADRASE